MKTNLKNILIVSLSIIFYACQSDEPDPSVLRLTSITVQEGEYVMSYTADGTISSIKYIEGVDVTNYDFTWSQDKHMLTMLRYIDPNDITTNTFEYVDVLIDGKPKTVLYKVIFDNEGDGGKLIQINWINKNGSSLPNFIEGLHYDINGGGDMGDATWTVTESKIVLDYSTNEEVVNINFDKSVDAWWTKVPAEITAVLFENEFYYPYFLSMKEVTSIENAYQVKGTPDYNDTFEYQYDNDGSILQIENTAQTVMFAWTKK